MILAFDVGNRNVTFGVFDDDTPQFICKVATDDRKTEDQYAIDITNILQINHISVSKINGAIISSVVPTLSPIIRRAVEMLAGCPVISISSGIKTGLNIKTDTPRQLGTDIVCGAVWVKNQKKYPAVLADMGTATTVAAIDAAGSLIGYSILPGMEISLQALRRYAVQLPAIGLDTKPEKALGKNTVGAMASGIFYGYAGAVDSILSRFRNEMGEPNANIILTGEYASILSPFLKAEFILDEYVILKGLWEIWKKNHFAG